MFIMENQVRYVNSLLGFALIINILANLFLIPKFGIEGAATATLSANFFPTFLFIVPFLSKPFNIHC